MKYRLREPIPDDVLPNYSPLVRHLLYHRGLTTTEEAEQFLNPDFDTQIHDHSLLKDIDKAVDRIVNAIENDERIAIYSDYDTDGIPGAVIVHDLFVRIGFTNFINYIPHRNKEGFGLNTDAIDTLAQDEVKLIITLDCGIANVDEVAYANKKDIDVIVTDHHLAGEKLPEAYAIVNPKQETCQYPEDMLCGSGVMFKLITALLDKKREDWNIPVGWEKWLLDMVGIATLSDMVPLRGENRVLAHYGLLVLRKSRRPGLQKLLYKLRANQSRLTEEDIGFTIGPRINAASRMGVPIDAFKLLSTKDFDEATRLADHLIEINDKRKGVVAAMVREAHKKIKERYKDAPKVIVIGNPDWQPSLLGLLANKLAEEYECPAYIWGRGDGKDIKGSCRSWGGVHLVDLMRAVPEGTFIESGGHAESGGFSINFDAVHTLPELLEEAYDNIANEKKDNELIADKKLSLEEVTTDFYRELSKLGPFGVGNEKPVFLLEGVTPSALRTFGKAGTHTELMFDREFEKPLKAIGFFTKPEQYTLTPEAGKECGLLATVEESQFMGRVELRLRIVDVI